MITESRMVGPICDPGTQEEEARFTASSKPSGLHINTVTNNNPTKQINKYKKRMTGICPKRSRSIEMFRAERKKETHWGLEAA